MQKEVSIRRATETDLPQMADLNSRVFLGHRGNPAGALEWVTSLFRSFPRGQYFVCHVGDEFGGYIFYEIQGGFLRPSPAIELEQLAIEPRFNGQGLATFCTLSTLREMQKWVQEKDTMIESHMHFHVWAYENNGPAIAVYQKTFGEECGSRMIHGDRRELCFRRRVARRMPAELTDPDFPAPSVKKLINIEL